MLNSLIIIATLWGFYELSLMQFSPTFIIIIIIVIGGWNCYKINKQKIHFNACKFVVFFFISPQNKKNKKKKHGNRSRQNVHRWKNRYGPHFEDIPTVGNVTNITVPIGNAVYLNCRISLLQDKTVCNLFAYLFVFFF